VLNTNWLDNVAGGFSVTIFCLQVCLLFYGSGTAGNLACHFTWYRHQFTYCSS